MKHKQQFIKSFHFLYNVFSILLLSIALYCLLGMLWQHRTDTLFFPFGYRPVVILSGSMEKELPTGSIVIVKKTKNVKENDILFFLTNDQTPVIHRYIATDENGNFITKGDANPLEDLESVTIDQIYGKVIKVFD